jgi:tRNA dimethylallyltransferase
LSDEYAVKIFGLIGPRENIYSNINSRVEKMFREGVLKEVERLKKKVLSKTAKAALGFKEISGYLNGGYDLETAKELMKRNTRRFAKRQISWFKADKRIKWFDVDRLTTNEIIRNIVKEAR